MLLVHGGAFPGGRNGADAAFAIEAGVVELPRVDKGSILVYAVEAGSDVPRCRVIEEVTAFPAPAPEADATVAEAVINSAIKSDVRPPVAGMPAVSAGRESPVA